jgi:hypothetical protein
MSTYTAEFRTDADYATHTFKARSPRHALKQARALYDEHTEDLIFMSYDGGHPVNEIEVTDADGAVVAVWHDDDLRLRLAADDMLEALDLCIDCLTELARDDDGTPSISALNQARAAVAKAKGETISRPGTRRPSGPKEKLDNQVEAAGAALRRYQTMTGCDFTDSLGDLLRSLIQWSERNNFDFECALFRAQHQHEAGDRP